MAFKRETTFFNQEVEPQTSYQKARQVWDERIGTARVQAHNWRLIAFGLLGLSFFMGGAIVWQMQQSRIVPYVIEVGDKGEVKAVGSAIKSYNPKDAQISFFLAEFIKNFRGLSVDPIIVRKNWLAAYDYVAGKGKFALDEYARANDPFSKVGKVTVSVEIITVVRVTEDAFQVRWIERTHQSGILESTKNYTSILSISIQQPADANTLQKNPLGIYVKNFDWSQDLNLEGAKK